MNGTMEFNEVLTLCGWFFVIGGCVSFGALFGVAVFEFLKQVFRT